MSIHVKRHDGVVHERKIRASISFPEQQYQVMERIAAENKVSVAWVVRDAIDGYLKSKWPLLLQGTDAHDAKQISERT